jgi:hypothetical protein
MTSFALVRANQGEQQRLGERRSHNLQTNRQAIGRQTTTARGVSCW